MIKANTKYYPNYIGKNTLTKVQFTFFKQRITNAIKRGEIKTNPVINKHTGFVININNIKHGINTRGSVLKTKSFTVIREILKYALLFDMAADKHGSKNTVYYFIYVMLIDGEPYEVRFTVKTEAKNKYYYHHDLMNIKQNKKINPSTLQ